MGKRWLSVWSAKVYFISIVSTGRFMMSNLVRMGGRVHHFYFGLIPTASAWLIDWLIDQLICFVYQSLDWLIDWLIDQLICFVYQYLDWLIDLQEICRDVSERHSVVHGTWSTFCGL
jgi:hypothetical protein